MLEKPRPYKDYIEWLKQRDLLKDEKFWRQTLSGFTSPTPLPLACSPLGRRTVQANVSADEVRLSAILTSALHSFADDHNLTLNTLIQGAWALLLNRYTGEDDIIFGATRSCRHTTINGANSMIGLFINTLPMRVRIIHHQSVLSWLKELRKQHVELREYEHTPLHKVQQWSDVPPGSQLFESLVVFENYLLNTYLRAKGGRWLNREFLYRGQTNYPLTFLCYADNELLLRIEYNQDLFDQSTVHRMLGHVQALLEGIIANPEQNISGLPLLTKEERHKILFKWNATQKNYPANKLIHQLFEAQAEQTPEAIAVVFEGETLTYRELNERANQVAHYLQSIGIGLDVPVGVAFERSLEMVVALYGILKAGGAYLPVDPTYPAERITYMLENSQVPLLLTQSKILNKLPRYQGRVICLDTNWNDIIRGQSRENPFSKVTLKDLAYVIYTSGSTGKPKGVMNTHRGILNRLLWMQDVYQLTSSDLVLQKTPFSFDVSVWEFFWPLMFGACLVVARPEGHKDNDYLIQIIIDRQITTIHFVPSMLQLFLESNNVDRCVSLRNVICSGEVLPVDLKDRFLSKLNAKLHNLYGPTEAAVDVTYYECQRESNLRTVPIGRPIANTRIYILDRSMQPVPIGVVGELHIGGVQVARGYLNRPELTAERFIPDPFSEDPEARLYKTGDLARYLPDGNIEYLGRMDYQIKIRGLRIELDEIESVLSEHPAVREAVVLVREDVPGDKRLVAYIVQGKDSPISITELRSFLEKKLPEYMLPAGYVELEALPLTPNGKVDRRALPAPEYKRQTDVDYIAPQNELHKTIASIWKELLRVEKVGIRDNFFDLGGNSLLLVQAYHRLSDIVNRELSVTDMFRFPTIEKLSTYLLQEKSEDSSFGRIFNRTRKQREIFNRQKELRNKKMKNFG
jgi:amino acid adenylation domain-containing protein